MYNAGLVLEGGSMRGVYTAGVVDAFLDNDIEFSSVYGVSAGACHGVSLVSKQRGRAFRVNVDYIDDKNYCSIYSLIKTGNLFGADMLFNKIPKPIFLQTNIIFPTLSTKGSQKANSNVRSCTPMLNGWVLRIVRISPNSKAS